MASSFSGSLHIGTVADVPVYVSPWFFLLMAWSVAQAPTLASGLIWAIAVFVSLMVHEFGHALVARAYRLNPQVLLHGWGGLCAHDRAARDQHDFLIVSAGPGAGFLFAGVVWLVSLVLRAAAPSAPSALVEPVIGPLIGFLLWINIGWGLVNLLPVWPLDGGQLFRLVLLRFMRPLRAERVTAGVGLALCVAAGWFGISSGHLGLTAILVFLVAKQNFDILRGEASAGPVRASGRFANGLLTRAKEAYAQGDWAEASRLCHQLRGEANVPPRTLDQAWRILGLSARRLGKNREAASYLKRAPFDAEVAEAWLRALVEDGREQEAEELLASQDWRRLGARGQEIRRALLDPAS